MKVSLLYTNICNINCKHCFISKALPQKRMEKMLFTKIIKEICKEKNRIKSVSISGGEPMLFLDEIVNLIKANKFEQELSFSISSNASWATTMVESNRICSELSSINVNRLEISYDLFHAEFVDIINVFNAVKAAQKLGITIYIVFSVANGFDYLPLYVELCKIIDKKKIILQHVANYGNAKQYGLDCILPISAFEDKRCYQILNPCIDYNGDFYACCGANTLKQDTPLYIGNIYSGSFKDLTERMNRNLKIQQILKEGPFQLLKDKDVQVCSSLCELCDLLD